MNFCTSTSIYCCIVFCILISLPLTNPLMLLKSIRSRNNYLIQSLFLFYPFCSSISLKFQFSSALYSSMSCSPNSSYQNNIKPRSVATNVVPLQIGLTGSIGMGKSSVTKHFRDIGFAVFDADACVHQLYAKGGKAVDIFKLKFPDVIVEDQIDRSVLSKKILQNEISLKEIESIVHPLVARERKEFYQKMSNDGHFCVIYDIPLLFENPENHSDIDYIIVVTASAEVQRQRCLLRPNMTVEKFESILKKQVPDEIKRNKADFIIQTDFSGFSEAKAQVAKVVENLIAAHPARWSAWKTRQAYTTITKRLSEVETSALIQKHIDVVVFDLDDTLVSTSNSLRDANDKLYEFMKTNMPRTFEVIRDDLKPTIQQIIKEKPLISHDLTRIRKEAMLVISQRFNEDIFVEDALNLFIKARSEVGKHAFEDTLPCINWLRSLDIAVCVVTNGNANLSLCEILGPKLLHSICALEVGAMKPSPVPFIAISHRTQVPPHRILFIGDSYENDVKGSIHAGMIAGYLVRDSNKHPDYDSSYMKGKGLELDSLHPDSLEKKLEIFLKDRN